MDVKIDDFSQNALLMSPPASDTGSQAGFSPYSIDSEPGSPLLDDAKVPDISMAGSGGCVLFDKSSCILWL